MNKNKLLVLFVLLIAVVGLSMGAVAAKSTSKTKYKIVKLQPTFNKDTLAYTTSSTNLSDTLSYTTESATATVVTELNGVAFTGSTVTWTASTDTLDIIVTDGSMTKTYTITCTH